MQNHTSLQDSNVGVNYIGCMIDLPTCKAKMGTMTTVLVFLEGMSLGKLSCTYRREVAVRRADAYVDSFFPSVSFNVFAFCPFESTCCWLGLLGSIKIEMPFKLFDGLVSSRDISLNLYTRWRVGSTRPLLRHICPDVFSRTEFCATSRPSSSPPSRQQRRSGP